MFNLLSFAFEWKALVANPDLSRLQFLSDWLLAALNCFELLAIGVVRMSLEQLDVQNSIKWYNCIGGLPI